MSEEKIYRQVVLKHIVQKGVYDVEEAWLEDNPKLKEGNRLTLKNHDHPDWWWEIIHVSSIALPKRLIMNERGWMEKDFHGRLTGNIVSK